MAKATKTKATKTKATKTKATKVKATKKNTINIEEKLKALHQLQVIDSEVDKIRIVRGELPLEIQGLEDMIEGLNTRFEKFQEELRLLKEDFTTKKNTISLATDAIQKYEKQLKIIKNNREFTSLTKEIEFQNLEIELAEKKIKENEAKRLHKKEVINVSKEQLEEQSEDLKLKTGELDTIIKQTEKEEKELLKQSVKSQKVIEERLLKAYQRIRGKVHNGMAVVSVDRDACGGCFNQIPPQRQLDIQMHKKVIVCEHCGRILVDSNMFEQQEA